MWGMMQLTVKDTAKLLDVSEKTIYRWIKQKVIPCYRINEQFRFNRAELLEWATSRRIQISPEIFLETETSKVPLPSLIDALRSGGVAYRIAGNDKPSFRTTRAPTVAHAVAHASACDLQHYRSTSRTVTTWNVALHYFSILNALAFIGEP